MPYTLCSLSCRTTETPTKSKSKAVAAKDIASDSDEEDQGEIEWPATPEPDGPAECCEVSDYSNPEHYKRMDKLLRPTYEGRAWPLPPPLKCVLSFPWFKIRLTWFFCRSTSRSFKGGVVESVTMTSVLEMCGISPKRPLVVYVFYFIFT